MIRLIFFALPLLWAQFAGLGGNGQPGYGAAPSLPTTDLLDAWEADDIVSCSGAITGTWAKHAGSTANGVVVDGGAPTCATAQVNGHAATTVNGTTDYFGVDTNVIPLSSSSNSNIAFYFIVKPAGAGTSRALTAIDGTVQDAPVVKLNTSNTVQFEKQGVVVIGTSSTAVSAAWHEIGVIYNGTTVSFYLDGVADGTASSVQNFAWGTTRIGTNVNGSGTPVEFFNGQIAAFYFYGNNTGITNQSAVHAYLQSKYGV